MSVKQSESEEASGQQVLAIFDIDGTLLVGPSTERRFFKFLREKHQLSIGRWVLFVSFLLSQWVRFGINVGRKDKAYLTDLSQQRVAELAHDLVRTRLLHCFIQSSLEHLRWHQAQGHRVVLLSGTLQEIAEALGEELGVRDVIGTCCSMVGDRFDSSAPWRHPYGREKLAITTTYSDALNVKLSDAYAYGNSNKDRFLLNAVGRAVVVRPDYWLRRIATRNCWEVLSSEVTELDSIHRPV